MRIRAERLPPAPPVQDHEHEEEAMMSFRRLLPVVAILLLVAGVAAAGDRPAPSGPHPLLTAPGQQAVAAPKRTPDVIYVPTPQEVVDAMLKVAKVTKDDTVYDLGCGDGRIVVTAAKEYGAHGVGVDIDPQRIAEANANVQAAGVGDKVKIVEGDLFEMDLRPATVVTLYLLPSLNLKLQPKLFKELKPGTRIVSHAFDMGDWKPEQELDVDGRRVYFWTIPAKKQ
jgi:precorrin-6B methylase 2